MVPETPGIASGHPHHMRSARHLRREIPGHAIGFEVMRINHVEAALAMHA
jgi:hypothetical protein